LGIAAKGKKCMELSFYVLGFLLWSEKTEAHGIRTSKKKAQRKGLSE